jgi:glycosyltransferase involved in cell wall biosynthesis
VTVSACLIARDEERTLGRCLQSVREHVDEIVVVDTGSRDRTKEIAGQFGARIYHFPWRNDFAAARQVSFDRATGQWLFWVDADDVVWNAAAIRPAAAAAPAEVNCFYWKYQASRDAYGNSTCEFWRERCVRNHRGFRWRGRVHEVLLARSRQIARQDNDVVVVHHRDHAHRNPHRNLDILQTEYAKSASHPPARLLYYLGNEYADVGQRDIAIDYLRQYVAASRWQEEKYLALVRIAELHRAQQRFDAAVEAAHEAVATIPEWPTACFSLAETYYFMKDWALVVYWAEAGQRRPVPDTVCVINPTALRYSWIIFYTNALFYVGRVQDALDWTCRALEMCPGAEWHVANRSYFSARLGAPQTAATVNQPYHAAP